MSIYIIALLFVGLLFITHLFGGWKKEYFQGKFLTTIKTNFLKSFFVALVAVLGVVGIAEGLQSVYPPVFEYSLSFGEPSEDVSTIGLDESGSLIQTDADGTVTELGFTKNWGVKKALILVNWILIFYLLPLFCLFMTTYGSKRSKGLSVGGIVFYIVFLFILGNTIAGIIAWVLLFSFYDFRNAKFANRLAETGLSYVKVDEKFQEIMSPYVFWFMTILLSGVVYVTML
jgi:hypothetical protein